MFLIYFKQKLPSLCKICEENVPCISKYCFLFIYFFINFYFYFFTYIQIINILRNTVHKLYTQHTVHIVQREIPLCPSSLFSFFSPGTGLILSFQYYVGDWTDLPSVFKESICLWHGLFGHFGGNYGRRFCSFFDLPIPSACLLLFVVRNRRIF